MCLCFLFDLFEINSFLRCRSLIYLLAISTNSWTCIRVYAVSLCGIPRRDSSQFSGCFAMSLDFTAWGCQRLSEAVRGCQMSGLLFCFASLTWPCFAGPPEIRTRNQDPKLHILQWIGIGPGNWQSNTKKSVTEFFLKSQGCKFKSCKQEHVDVRRFFCGNEGSCWWAGFQTCIWKSWHAWGELLLLQLF